EPPKLRLATAESALPTCSEPVGLGAKRTRVTRPSLLAAETREARSRGPRLSTVSPSQDTGRTRTAVAGFAGACLSWLGHGVVAVRASERSRTSARGVETRCSSG